MRLRLILFLSLMIPGTELTAQEPGWKDTPVNLKAEKSSKRAILTRLEKTVGYFLAYPEDLLGADTVAVAVNWREKPLLEAIRSLFPDHHIEVTKLGNSLVITSAGKKKRRCHLYGYLLDAATGESLIGATVMANEWPTPQGSASNQYGFYSLALPAGQYHLQISYLGYAQQERSINLTGDQRLDIQLQADARSLSEVVVVGSPVGRDQNTSAGSRHRLDLQQLKKQATIGGEPDILKAVQARPGVNQAGEGSSGLYVRGGNIDQNLVLLDEAPVYHPSHFLGFFSTFHPDAIRYADLYTGNFPVQYGGRLSSVLNLRMKEGNRERTVLEGGIGLLASRMLVEGPLKKEQHSFLFAARRTYPDLFLHLFSADDGGNKVHFYDLNAKFNFTLSPRDRLYFSTYRGKDVFRFFDAYENTWGNTTATLRWNRIFSAKLFGNFTAVFSRFRYRIDNYRYGKEISSWESGVRDFQVKADLSYTFHARSKLRFGMENILHHFEPGKDRLLRFEPVPESNTLEQAVYLGHHWETGRWSLDYGIRLSANHNLGPAKVYQFNANHQLTDTLSFGPGVYQSVINPAPRLKILFQADPQWRIYMGYSRTWQYLQELRNSATGFNAFYTFYPADRNLPGQRADQVNLGMDRLFRRIGLHGSLEVYYKWLGRQIDFAPHSSLLQNPLVAGSIRSGKGNAYGLEFLLEKNTTSWQASLSYTYARSFRTIAGINAGKPYPTYYDQPHAVKLALQYQPRKRWEFSLNWQYHSGGATTLPIGSYQYDGTVVPIYGERNAQRLPVYHRLDVSATLNGKSRPGRSFRSYWVFSLYNAYHRKNTLSIDLMPREEPGTDNVPDPTDVAVFRTYLLGIIPSVAYHFKLQ